jgi:hypothetical protein
MDSSLAAAGPSLKSSTDGFARASANLDKVSPAKETGTMSAKLVPANSAVTLSLKPHTLQNFEGATFS